MKGKFLLAVAAIAALGLAACGSNSGGGSSSSTGTQDFHGETLSTNLFGGGYTDAWEKYVIGPFEKKYDAKVVVTQALTGNIVAKVIAEQANPQFDVVMGADTGIFRLAQMGLLQPVDSSKIPVLSQLNPGSVPDNRMYVNYEYSLDSLSYNTNKITTAPTAWTDLWNPAYKGHVILPGANTCCAVTFLIELDKALGADYHQTMQPAFDKLKELRSSVLTVYTSHDQATTVLSSGDAWIAAWSGDRSYAAKLAGDPVGTVYPITGSVEGADFMGITKGSKHLALAEAYINFALQKEQMINTESQAILVPSRTDALAALPPKAKDGLPTPAEAKNAILLDYAFVAQHESDWLAEYNQILGAH